MAKSSEYRKFEEEISRLKSKLVRQQDHHLDAMKRREAESAALWHELNDENDELRAEVKALKHTINETRDCGHHRDVSRWQITLNKADEEKKELQLEVLSLLGQLQDRNELQSKIDELQAQLDKVPDDNSDNDEGNS